MRTMKDFSKEEIAEMERKEREKLQKIQKQAMECAGTEEVWNRIELKKHLKEKQND